MFPVYYVCHFILLVHSLDLCVLYLPLFMMTLMKRDADDDDIQYTATTGKGKRKRRTGRFVPLSLCCFSFPFKTRWMTINDNRSQSRQQESWWWWWCSSWCIKRSETWVSCWWRERERVLKYQLPEKRWQTKERICFLILQRLFSLSFLLLDLMKKKWKSDDCFDIEHKHKTCINSCDSLCSCHQCRTDDSREWLFASSCCFYGGQGFNKWPTFNYFLDGIRSLCFVQRQTTWRWWVSVGRWNSHV